MAESKNNPLTRPDPQEQGGTSEHSTESAHIDPSERPEEARGVDREGPPRRDEIAEAPDELGRRFLEGATQQPEGDTRPESTDRPLDEDQEVQVSAGERATREQTPDARSEAGPVTTDMPNRTEHEERVSAETRERLKAGESPREGPEETDTRGSSS